MEIYRNLRFLGILLCQRHRPRKRFKGKVWTFADVETEDFQAIFYCSIFLPTCFICFILRCVVVLCMENIGWWISVRDEQDKRCLAQSQHGLIALYGEHKCNMYICCIHKNYIYNILHIKHILNLIIFLLFCTSQAVVFLSAIVLQVWRQLLQCFSSEKNLFKD